MISVLIPLNNAEAIVRTNLLSVIEIVADIHHDFEILMVDDGSVDETAQILVELSRTYPQVSAISSRKRRGFVAAVQAGLDMLRGDTVFIQDGASRPSSEAYRKLWNQRHDRTAAPIPANVAGLGNSWLGRLVEWGTQVSGGVCRVDVPSGLQMIRRRAISVAPSVGEPRRLMRTDRAIPGGVLPANNPLEMPVNLPSANAT